MITLQRIQAMYGLKWNPFLPDVPPEALYKVKQMEDFCWKVENIVLDGGFTLITGDPGVGKSTTLRLIAEHLSAIPDVNVKSLSLARCSLRDFYRELAHLYEIDVSVSNRFGNFRKLRERWSTQIRTKHFRPVLIIDEAQDMTTDVLLELRLLGSTDFDSRCILGIILAGDRRLGELLNSPTLLPLQSRIRARLFIDSATNADMAEILAHALRQAGNPELLSPGLIRALADNSLGNPRTMMHLANEILSVAAQRGEKQLTEELFFDIHKHIARKKR